MASMSAGRSGCLGEVRPDTGAVRDKKLDSQLPRPVSTCT